ncbi:hypothetical protein ACGFX4_29185 [Kitasatospora sp. NPDC048365]|uniref:hypothetical protein n=1 Tax=Kitasatospora sp. NPDC048365 TaxID=3364050 RepID=UPI003723AAE8
MQHPSYDPSSQPTQPGFGPPSYGPHGHPPERRSNAKVWGAIAAVVSAVAGVASAAAAFMGGGDSPNPAPAPQVTVTVAAQAGTGGGTASAPSAQGTAAPAPAPGTAAKVVWTGPFRLGMEGVDLTSNPPAAGTSGSFLFLRPDAQRSGSNGMVVKGTVAPWSGTGEPTAEGCRVQLLTQKRQEVEVAVNDQVCVVEGSSPIGVLKITGVHYDAGSYGELDTVLTVWNLKMNR